MTSHKAIREPAVDPARCYSSGMLSDVSSALHKNPTEMSELISGSLMRLSGAGSYSTIR